MKVRITTEKIIDMPGGNLKDYVKTLNGIGVEIDYVDFLKSEIHDHNQDGMITTFELIKEQ